jgi:Zn-dependent M28 family amino/carboxypeptidase
MNTSHLFAAVTLSASALLIGCNASQNSVFYSPKANSVAVETTSPLVQNHTSLAHLEPLISHAQQSDLAFNIVKSLTVEVGPRIAGSKGDKRAVAWAEAKFAELGFDKIYKQPVRVRNWERGFADAKVLAPYPQDLVISALGGSIATPDGGLDAQVVMFGSLDELTQADAASIAGKIVFLNTRMQRDKAGRFYGKVVPNRVNGAVEAAKLGAQAVIIRSVGTDNSRFAHTGVMRYDDNVAKIPAGAISTADADVLEAMFEQDQLVRIAVNMQAKDAGWQTSYNVIGEITGSERPEEVILIGAHLDSWDEGTGALDDGAGVGIVMAAANHIKTIVGQPKRTIRVVLFAAEEIGLIGAYEYVRTNKADLPNIIMAAESDFGAGSIYRMDTRFADAVREQPKGLYQRLASLGVELGSNDTNGGPDVSMMPKYGVPVIALKQDGYYYFDYHHTPNDTLDKINPDELRQNQTIWALVTAYMAMSDFDPRPAAL